MLGSLMLTLSLLMTPTASKSLKVGNKALDFTLTTFTGETVRLKDHLGKVILLDFWASWCLPCKQEMPYLDILQKTYGKRGFLVLAVNIDNQSQNAIKFLKKLDIQLFTAWDQEKKVVAAYDVTAMPTSLFIDQRGWIRSIHSGFKPEDFPEYKKEVERLLNEKEGRAITRNKRVRAKP